MRRLLLGLVVLFLVPGSALADVVRLTNGREVRGRIEEETAYVVVVRTSVGRIVLSKETVREIVRESLAITKLGQARELAKAQDAKAIDAFERAIEAADVAGDKVTA